jgi:hypothetical protein
VVIEGPVSALAQAFAASLMVAHEPMPTERFVDFLRWVKLDPSDAIEAIGDASEGRPLQPRFSSLCPKLFGCSNDNMPTQRLRVVVVRAGGRGGKTSRLLAPMALFAALTVPLPTLTFGEHAVSLLIAPRELEAMQILNFVRGIIASRPELRALVVNRSTFRGEERLGDAKCIVIRRADGKLVDIRIGVAGSGGLSARAKTLVFAGLDEAAFFRAEGELTDKALYQAAIQRIVPGGQLWMVSTPWIEGFGVMEEHFKRDFGKGSRALTLCATGTTRMLNPSWDPDGTIEQQMRVDDPDNASREIDAIPLPAGSKLFFPPELLAKAINENRERVLDFDPRFEHFAAGDLGFRRNSSAMGNTRLENEIARLVPSEVCRGFGEACARYGTFDLMVDYESIESAREHLSALQLADPRDKRMHPGRRSISITEFNPGTELEPAFTRVRTRMSEGLVEIPNDARLLSQLRRVTSKPLAGGRMSIVIPRVGNAHGDLALASVMSLARFQESSYTRKLDELDATLRGVTPEPKKTAKQLREEHNLEQARRMTSMPKKKAG